MEFANTIKILNKSKRSNADIEDLAMQTRHITFFRNLIKD